MKIGFIGTGLMGAPMVKALLREGLEVLVWNRTAAKAEALVPFGAEPSPLREIGAACDPVVMMLTDAPQTEEVLFGPAGLAEALHAGQTVIDMSSAAPAASRALADRLQLYGMDLDKNAIQRIESGQRFVTDIELKAISQVLDVSVDVLIQKNE